MIFLFLYLRLKNSLNCSYLFVLNLKSVNPKPNMKHKVLDVLQTLEFVQMSSSFYEYSIKYETCSSDSFSNTCATNCCTASSGGVLDPVKYCTRDATLCVNGTETTIQTQKCGMDLSQNKCFEECCATYTTGDASSMTCEAGMLCKGINPRALTLSNFQNYKSEIQQAMIEMPTINRDGKIALGVLGGMTGLLIILLALLCWALHKEQKRYSDYIDNQVKGASSSEKTQLISQSPQRK